MRPNGNKGGKELYSRRGFLFVACSCAIAAAKLSALSGKGPVRAVAAGKELPASYFERLYLSRCASRRSGLQASGLAAAEIAEELNRQTQDPAGRYWTADEVDRVVRRYRDVLQQDARRVSPCVSDPATDTSQAGAVHEKGAAEGLQAAALAPRVALARAPGPCSACQRHIEVWSS